MLTLQNYVGNVQRNLCRSSLSSALLQMANLQTPACGRTLSQLRSLGGGCPSESPAHARIPRVGVKVLIISQHAELLVIVIKLPSRVPPQFRSNPQRHARQRRLVRQRECLHAGQERRRRACPSRRV